MSALRKANTIKIICAPPGGTSPPTLSAMPVGTLLLAVSVESAGGLGTPCGRPFQPLVQAACSLAAQIVNRPSNLQPALDCLAKRDF